jgi:DNA-binding NarL/FixJ family response regulator
MKPLLSRSPSEGLLAPEEVVQAAAAVDLTAREIEVAQLLLEGKTRKKISAALGLCPGTIRVYIDGVFKKFQVRTNVELVQRMIQIALHLRNEQP